MADDRIRILCTRCKNPFREALSNVRDGFQSQCPNCYRMLIFDNDSQDQGIRRALRDARRARTGYVPPSQEPQRF